MHRVRPKIFIKIARQGTWLNEHDDENDVDVDYGIDDDDDNNVNVHDDDAFDNTYGYWLILMELKCPQRHMSDIIISPKWL